ncbi:MAG: DUF4280 domain-containing protein [Anaerolineae bacterium]|nr:DUF4280 domain-containing protein [Anaerolineae bacterium]
MPKLVCSGSVVKCPFGLAPATLSVIPKGLPVRGDRQTAANIMDFQAMANIAPFGMCSSPANPQVVAALMAPQPCLPVITGPWTPGSPTVLVNGQPALNATSTCMCAWGGVIQISSPRQVSVEVS